MRAVVFREPGRVEVAEVPDPAIRDPGDAIVRVRTSAICGSDLHFLHGKAPLDPGESIGHEATGVVERVGDGVTRFAAGDRVAVSFAIACGACWFCRRGQTQLCEDARVLGAGMFGGSLGGAQAELLRVPAADVNLLAVGDSVEDERAVFLGDALAAGYHAAEAAEIEEGDTVAVVGAGPVGNLAAQAARLHGSSDVIAIDPEADRLALLEAVGVATVNGRERNPATAVAERTAGRGADVVVEAVGRPETYEQAFYARDLAGTVVLVGVPTPEMKLELPLLDVFGRGGSLKSSWYGDCLPSRDFPMLIDLYLQGRLDLDAFVSETIGLGDVEAAFEKMHHGDVLRSVVIL